MKRRPQRLFRARRHGPMLFIEPQHHHVPNYQKPVAALAASLLGKVRPGELVHVLIAHDDDCQHWQGKGCNCSPDVSLAAPPPARGA